MTGVNLTRKGVVSMAANKPLWQRGVEAVDKMAAPVLEGATRHDAFGLGLSLVQQTRRAVYRRTERISRQVLHGLNLPTASDVNRLLTQIAAVENRVRQLDNRLERELPPGNDVKALPSMSRRNPSTAGSATDPKDGPSR
jgi:hypothetical protein